MPSISFHQQFLIDLVGSGDAQLSNRVLKKMFTDSGEFRLDRDDHRYDGIENAWIRVISRGRTAFRVIYIRNRDSITFYRAGPHSVEDNLAAPTAEGPISVSDNAVIERGMRPMGMAAEIQRLNTVKRAEGIAGLTEASEGSENVKTSRFMKNHELRRLYHQITGRRLLPHKDVYLVSPFLSLDLLRSTQTLGQMLDRWIDDGCRVSLITKPPAPDQIAHFDALEARGFSIMYVPKLHAKAYVFRLDRTNLSQWETVQEDLMVIGSANLTQSGFNPSGELYRDPQLELSYAVSEADYNELEEFVTYLASVGTSHDVFRHRLLN